MLRRYRLLGAPYIPNYLQPNGTDKKMYREKIEELAPKSDLGYFFEVGFAAFRSLSHSLWQFYDYKPPDWVRRDMWLVSVCFLKDPERYALSLKSLFQSFKDCAFNMELVPEEGFGILFSECNTPSVERYLQAGAYSRSLPRPLEVGDAKEKVQKALSQPSTVSTQAIENFASWVKKWSTYFTPYFPRSSWRISPSASAVIEFSRKTGGAAYAFHLLSATSVLELTGTHLKIYEPILNEIKYECRLNNEDPTPFLHSLSMIFGALAATKMWAKHAEVCLGCDDAQMHPPLYILCSLERGWKHRVPTMTVGAIGVLSRLLRSVIDNYLRSDPRIKSSLEGRFDVPRHIEHLGYRSQDLTTATDNHDLRVTRAAYMSLPMIDRIPFWEEMVNVCCNNFTIIDDDTLLAIREDCEPTVLEPTSLGESLFKKWCVSGDYEGSRQQPVLIPKGAKLPTRAKLWFLKCGNGSLHRSTSGTVSYGTVTKRGQPMGIPSSWPLLPLISIYAFESSSQRPKKRLTRTVVRRPKNSFSNLLFTQLLDGTAATRVVNIDVPEDWDQIRVTGDDAIMQMNQEHSERHSGFLESLGASVSKTKDYFHTDLAVYTEIYLSKGRPFGILPMGPFLAPPCNRGRQTWYNQPDSLTAMEKLHCGRYLWRNSPYKSRWDWLCDQNIPIGLEPPLGLGVRGAFLRGDERLRGRIHLLNSMTIFDLFPELNRFKLPDRDVDGLLTRPMEPLRRNSKMVKKGMSETALNTLIKNGVWSSPVARVYQSDCKEMKLKDYFSLLRSNSTWEQLLVPGEDPGPPSLFTEFPRMPGSPLDLEAISEFRSDRDQTIEVPIGIAYSLKPTFGFSRATCHVPVFEVRNKRSVLEISLSGTEQ